MKTLLLLILSAIANAQSQVKANRGTLAATTYAGAAVGRWCARAGSQPHHALRERGDDPEALRPGHGPVVGGNNPIGTRQQRESLAANAGKARISTAKPDKGDRAVV